MKQIVRAMLSLIAFCVGFAVAAIPANAATASPWAFVQVQATGNTAGSSYVALTAYCPSGYTPVSGGISGPGPFQVLFEYSSFWNSSYSEQISAFVTGSFVLTAECARSDQVGSVQVVSTDFGRNSSGRAGGWVACPTGTRAIGGGADWNAYGERDIEYFAPPNDDAGWYAVGSSSTAGNTLHVEAYCVPAGELAGAQLVVQPYTNLPSGASLPALCPSDTRTLTGGVYAGLPGSGVDPGQFAGYVQDSYPDVNRYGWHASVQRYVPTGATVYVTAWCLPASIPTVAFTSAPPSVTARTSANFGFVASDPAGDPLTYTCILDGRVAGCDSATGSGYTGLGNGVHYFTVFVRNTDQEPASANYQWTVDTTAPTVTTTALKPFTLADSTTISWTGDDSPAGVASYQVRERTAAYSSGFTAWSYPSAWQALGPTTNSITASGLVKGVDYCFSVRATDMAGNTSAWSPQRCTARPLDDRSLGIDTHWLRGTGSRYWNATISTASTTGATASRAGVQLDRVGVVATRGPGMGTVAVYVGATPIGQINLTATTTQYQSLILLPPISYRTGTVHLKVVSTGKPVQLDGLAVSRS